MGPVAAPDEPRRSAMGSVSPAAPRPQTDLQSILATALRLLSKSLAIFLVATPNVYNTKRRNSGKRSSS